MRLKYLKFFRKKYIYLSCLLFVSLIFRLLLSNLGYHVDLISNAAWGQWIYENGTKGFYYNSNWIYAWPTQLPIINLLNEFNYWLYIQLLELFRYASSYIVPHLAPGHMLWYFKFVIWFDQAKFPESPVSLGYLVTAKLLPIIADLLIAIVLYLLALKQQHSQNKALIWPIIYLFSPFSWYISALWGQVDQLSFFLFLISILALFYKKLFLSVLLIAISIGIKPTTAVFIPYYLFLIYKQKVNLLNLGSSLLIISAFFIYTTLLFSDKNLLVFIYQDLIPKIVFKSEFRVSTNSFNFWHIIIGNKALNDSSIFLLLPAKIWGYIVYVLLNVLAFKLYKPNKLSNIFSGLFIIGIGSWLFMTNMLERYYFIGIVSLLCLTIYQPKLIKYWLIASLFFWINLYHGWWFPEHFNFLRLFLISNNGVWGRVIAFMNVSIFIICLRILFSKKALE